MQHTELGELESILENLDPNIIDVRNGEVDAREDDVQEDRENGVLLKAGVQLSVWNDLLMKDHRYPGKLCYEAGNVFIIELPSQPHDSAIFAIHDSISPLCRSHELKSCLSTRWIGADNVGREADSSYRPFLVPVGVNSQDYVTLIVEVGHSQSLGGTRGLRAKAQEWLSQYQTVAYVLLVSISKQLLSLRAELWERGAAANPTQTLNFSQAGAAVDGVAAPPQVIAIDVRRLLGLAAGAPIPHGHAAALNIDFDYVRAVVKD